MKADWEEKQKAKKDKEKEKEKEKAKDGDKEADKDKKGADFKEKDQKKDSLKSPSMPGSLSTSPPPAVHERYILHRDFFSSESRHDRTVITHLSISSSAANGTSQKAADHSGEGVGASSARGPERQFRSLAAVHP